MTQPFYFHVTLEKQKRTSIKRLEYKPHSRFICNGQNGRKSPSIQQVNG